MHTIDTVLVRAPRNTAWQAAAHVEEWPRILPHYRYVTRLNGDPLGDGTVEMAAWRPFGPLNWPTWWRSEITTDPDAFTVRYRHIGGITTGMDVLWQLTPEGGGTRITIEHWWQGPRWPLISKLAANVVIGPVFVHGIASRTLAAMAHSLEGKS